MFGRSDTSTNQYLHALEACILASFLVYLGGVRFSFFARVSTEPPAFQRDTRRLGITAECAPQDGDVWIIGTHKKTGTVLSKRILWDLGLSFLDLRWNWTEHAKWHCELDGGINPACIEHMVSSGQPILHNYALAANHATWPRLVDRAVAEAHLSHLRVVHFVRSPVNMILSAYFYNLRVANEKGSHVNEPNIFEKPNRKLLTFFSHCKTPGLWGLEDECSQVERKLKSKPHNSWSLVEAMQTLPPELGIFVQAAGISLHIQQMSETNATLKQTPSNVLTIDLDMNVSTDFNATFVRMFAFLGIPKARIGDCMERIAVEDVSSNPPPPADTHVSKSSEADLKERLRQVLMRSAYVDHIINSSSDGRMSYLAPR